jgi:hypothetical protein
MSRRHSCIVLAICVLSLGTFVNPSSAFGQTGIAANYLRDAGIGSDSDVIFSDNFESNITQVHANWQWPRSNAVTLVNDGPAASAGDQAVRIQPIGISGTLYKQLPQDYDQLYIRYYVKYEGSVYHHTGMSIGGYSPPTSYPQGDAGLKGIRPNGDRLIRIQFEERADSRLGFYANWIDMQGLDYQGLYYGRDFVSDLNIPIPVNQWRSVEVMVKLNSAPNVKDGELALWIDGVQQAHFAPGSPHGYWDILGNWQMDTNSPPFEGFLWRDVLDYGLNWVQLQNYDAPLDVWYDDLVVATKYIGPVNTGAIPEPSSLLLGALASIGLMLRRRCLTR